MIAYLAVVLVVAMSDTGQVRGERSVSIYSRGSIIHTNNSAGGIIPTNNSAAGIIPAIHSGAGIIPTNYSLGRTNRHSPAQQQPPDLWFGEDKFKHFALSYMITVGGYAGARFIAGHDESVWIGAGVGLAAGIAKELYDRKTNRSASLRDLLWDVAGVATGMVIAAHGR